MPVLVAVLVLAAACTSKSDATISETATPSSELLPSQPVENSPTPTTSNLEGEPLATEVVGDGSTVTRVVARNGSVFVLRLPESFGTSLALDVADEQSARIASVAGDGVGVHIEVGHCRSDSQIANALGVVYATPTSSDPPRSLLFCRPDELLRLVIDPVPDSTYSVDQFHVAPISFGAEYSNQIESLFGPLPGQCCFEDRGPLWNDGSFVLSNGHVDGQITAYDGETLVPMWTTDLLSVIESNEDWVGDGSFLQMLTESRRVIAHSGYGFVVALSGETGDVMWQADLAGESPAHIVLDAASPSALLVVSDVRSEGDQSAPSVRQLDLVTGAELWIAKGEPSTDVQGSKPVVMGDLLLFADVPTYQSDGEVAETAHVLAFDISSGERVWTAALDSATEGFTSAETIATDGARGLIIAMSVDGVLFRLDPETGDQIWRSTVGFGQIVGLSLETVTISRANQDVEIRLSDGTIVG